jgi:hypothetical protein
MTNVERSIHGLILRYKPSIWLDKLSKTTKYIHTYIYIYIYIRVQYNYLLFIPTLKLKNYVTKHLMNYLTK